MDIFMEPLIESCKRFEILYFYSTHLTKENKVSLYPLIIDDQGIFHMKKNLTKMILLLDSWHDFNPQALYICHRCPPLVCCELLNL